MVPTGLSIAGESLSDHVSANRACIQNTLLMRESESENDDLTNRSQSDMLGLPDYGADDPLTRGPSLYTTTIVRLVPN
jgi:hypothetical protein